MLSSPTRALTQLVLCGLVLGACARKGPSSVADIFDKLDFGMTPRLPSPEAGTYASAPEDPRDQVIGEMLRGKPHDGALAGAAAGLALSIAESDGGMARWELREALWRAGFPYPVYDARSWSVGLNQAPPRDLIAWLDALSKDEPMALVRARGRDFDAWVGIRARPALDIGSVPRMATLGTDAILPPSPGATWRASDAGGEVQEGPLDEGVSIPLTSSGEWLVEIVKDKQEFARFPIYVDVDAPTTPLLRHPDGGWSVATAADADAYARIMIDHIRDAYGMPRWKPSPILDSAVARYNEDPSRGSKAVLASMGFPDTAAVVWACDQVTVENCLDTWIWDTRRRRDLLTHRMDSYGLHVALDARGVHLTMLLVDAD